MAPKLSRMDAEPPPGMKPDGTLDVVVEAPDEPDDDQAEPQTDE